MLVGIPDDEPRDTILVWLSVFDIQERKRSIAALLGVIGRKKKIEPSASSKVILQRDVGRQVWAGVQGAGSLSIIEPSGKGVLEHPVCAGLGRFEAARCAVACIVYAVLEEQVDLCHNAGDVDAAEVAHASAFVGWGLEAGELVLGDLPFADRVLVVCVVSWK